MNTKSFTIILFSLIALSQCGGNESLIQKAQEDIKHEFTCYPGILRISLDNISGSEQTSKKASEEIKKICPQLDQTCCSLDQLNTLKESFLKGKEDVLKIKEIYWMVISLFKNHKDAIKKQFDDKKESLIKCLTPEQFNKKDTILNNLSKNIDSAEETLRNFYNSMLKYFSGYACELCGRNFHHIKKESSERKLTFHIDNIKTIKQNLEIFLEFSGHMFNFIYLSDAISCNENENHQTKLNSMHENNTALEQYINECSSIENNENFMANSCMELMEMHGLYDVGQILANIYDSFYDLYKKLSTFDEGLENKDGKKPEVLDKITFYSINRDALKNKLKIDEGNEGINLPANPMSKNIWKGIQLLTIGLAWVGFCLY